jgi:hypothetical protein
MLAIPVVLAFGGWVIQQRLQNQTVSRDYVQLAVSILKEPQTSNVDPQMRTWAVQLLNDNSPTRFNSQVFEQLKSGAAQLPESFNVTQVAGPLVSTSVSARADAADADWKALTLWLARMPKLLFRLLQVLKSFGPAITTWLKSEATGT